MRERALAALQLPQTEEPWGLGRLLMLELDALEGDPAELPTRLDAVEQAARRHRWTRVLPGVELLRLEHLRNTGELAAAVAGAVELRRTAREAGDAAGEGRALPPFVSPADPSPPSPGSGGPSESTR
jgi:hypothetical protein